MGQLVSIIAPCYNHEKYIEDFFESILNQTYDNLELIVCDDFSKDHSWDVIEKYRPKLEKKLKRVILEKNTRNVGVTQNLNKMIQKASGKYIKLASCDDFFLENCIEELVFFLEKEEAQVVFSDGFIVGEEDHYNGFYEKYKYYDVTQHYNEGNFLEKLYQSNFILGLGVLLERDLYSKYGLYNEGLMIDDWEMWLRYAIHSVQFKYFDKALVCYRQNEGSITSRVINSDFEDKRITYFKAQVRILKLYRNYVKQEIWIDTFWDLFTEERRFALSNQLRKLTGVINCEIVKFEGWRHIGLKKGYQWIRQIISDRKHYYR